MPTTTQTVLSRNLACIGRARPEAARLIASTEPAPDVEFVPTEDGVPSAWIAELGPRGPTRRALASTRRPIEEADRLVEPIDPRQTAAVVVVGFGLGWHVRQLARKLGRHGVIVVFEPDAGLLRRVLETIDHSEWLAACNLIVLTDPQDEAAIAAACRGIEHALAIGTQILEHPASRPRVAWASRGFLERFTAAMRAVRMTVVTTMVQTQATIRNATQNLGHYVTRGGIAPLRGACAGRMAVCVAAGPSLRRNAQLLADPAVRDRCVIIAAQTALKPLLRMGVRPHLVTALDHHQISARFYEGLSRDDLRGVTLVIEPKVNPAVPAAFQGQIRCAADATLDHMLGAGCAFDHGAIEPGATVAHLSYYLARFLGCDPVTLVGQDLGFTEGLYYGPGAAIHDSWACELGEFNTLETMEWQRIARGRAQLSRRADVHGRPIYTDEQMNAYLAQFQRDFARDRARGLRVIDATEGGVRKSHTEAAPLADALALHAGDPTDQTVDDLLATASSVAPAAQLPRQHAPAAAEQRLGTLIDDAEAIARHSRAAAQILDQMRLRHADQPYVNERIGELERLRGAVAARAEAWALVHRLNQTGGFNRSRADRDIALEAGLDPLQRQLRQIERDRTNVSWIADAADALGSLLRDALRTLRGGPPITSEPPPPAAASAPDLAGPAAPPARTARRVGAVIVAPASELSSLPRWPSGATLLETLLARLGHGPTRGTPVTIVTDAPALVRASLPKDAPLDGVSVLPCDAPRGAMGGPALRAARALSACSWRGGLAGATVFDEAFAPAWIAAALDAASPTLDAALVLSPRWPLIDTDLCARLIDASAHDPRCARVAFSQAAPGLGALVIDRRACGDLATAMRAAATHGGVGAMLGYVPIAPIADPIGGPACLPIDPALRDALDHAAPACALDAARIARALASAGLDPRTADGPAIARAISSDALAHPPQAPRHLIVSLSDAPLSEPLAAAIAGLIEPGYTAVTLHDDRPACPDLARCVALARSRGATAVHVRTTAAGDDAALDALIGSAPDIVSVDLVGADQGAFLAGRPDLGAAGFERSRRGVDRLLRSRSLSPSPPDCPHPLPWVVGRICRAQATLDQLEAVHDHWLMLTGAAVIDPPPSGDPRLVALPEPELARRRRARDTLAIDDSLCAIHDLGTPTIDPADPRRSWAGLAQARSARPMNQGRPPC